MSRFLRFAFTESKTYTWMIKEKNAIKVPTFHDLTGEEKGDA